MTGTPCAGERGARHLPRTQSLLAERERRVIAVRPRDGRRAGDKATGGISEDLERGGGVEGRFGEEGANPVPRSTADRACPRIVITGQVTRKPTSSRAYAGGRVQGRSRTNSARSRSGPWILPSLRLFECIRRADGMHSESTIRGKAGPRGYDHLRTAIRTFSGRARRLLRSLRPARRGRAGQWIPAFHGVQFQQILLPFCRGGMLTKHNARGYHLLRYHSDTAGTKV